ncbi:MAG TPA: ATP-binding protein, partial [Bacteroidales bacterium]
DGLGIPKNHLKNIFHLFSRGNMKDYKQIKGFGIGLYYVQKVVKAHQGKVSVKSEVGVGSEFVIDIPNRFL